MRTAFLIALSRDRLAFVVAESARGEDLNHDGDTADGVLQSYDFELSEATNREQMFLSCVFTGICDGLRERRRGVGEEAREEGRVAVRVELLVDEVDEGRPVAVDLDRA